MIHTMLFPKTDRTAMDLSLTRGESDFDPLDLDRFKTETRGLASVQIKKQREQEKIIKKTILLIPVIAIIGYLVLKK
tara:strand:- start:308 stop:538 length:231 start_codon:yes stop_codon:yes gene_type:complete